MLGCLDMTLNQDQRKHVAKHFGDAAKLIYLGSTALPLFGQAIPITSTLLGFGLAFVLFLGSIKMLE